VDQFVYPIIIPSTGTTGLYKEFSTSYYKSFVKILLNDNIEITGQFIDTIISNLTHTGPSVQSLTGYDKLYIMLIIRAYNISPNIRLGFKTPETKDKKSTTINANININEVIEILDSLSMKHFFTINHPGGMMIKGSLPSALAVDNFSWLIASCIDEIHIKDKVTRIRELPYQQQIEILDKLPSGVFTDVINFLQDQHTILSSASLFDIDLETEVEGPTDIKLGIVDSTMFEFIKLLYRCDLKEFYQSEYQLCKAKMPLELIHSSTPAEITLYYNIISEYIKKEQEEMKKSNEPKGMQLPGNPVGGM